MEYLRHSKKSPNYQIFSIKLATADDELSSCLLSMARALKPTLNRRGLRGAEEEPGTQTVLSSLRCERQFRH